MKGKWKEKRTRGRSLPFGIANTLISLFYLWFRNTCSLLINTCFEYWPNLVVYVFSNERLSKHRAVLASLYVRNPGYKCIFSILRKGCMYVRDVMYSLRVRVLVYLCVCMYLYMHLYVSICVCICMSAFTYASVSLPIYNQKTYLQMHVLLHVSRRQRPSASTSTVVPSPRVSSQRSHRSIAVAVWFLRASGSSGPGAGQGRRSG